MSSTSLTVPSDQLGAQLDNLGRRFGPTGYVFELAVRPNRNGTHTITIVYPTGTILPPDPGANPALAELTAERDALLGQLAERDAKAKKKAEAAAP